MVANGFYLLSIISIIMLIPIFKRNLLKYGLFVLLWLVYLVLVLQFDLLESWELPPRIPIFLVIPGIVISLLIVNRRSFKSTLANTSLHYPVLLQSFRIFVELLIFGAFINGVLPQQVTFEGTNYDILVGISAPFMAYFIWKGKASAKSIMIWNIVSILILTTTIGSFVYSFYFSDFLSSGGSSDLLKPPYVLLPAILVLVALFLHIFSIKQLLTRRSDVD